MGRWDDDAKGVGWRSGGRDGLAVLGRPSRFDPSTEQLIGGGNGALIWGRIGQ